MTEAQNTQGIVPHRFGLTQEAIFRLWTTAIKDDQELVDDAISAVYEQMISFDRARAERVISLIIRRHREARGAFKSLLSDLSIHPKSLDLRVE